MFTITLTSRAGYMIHLFKARNHDRLDIHFDPTGVLPQDLLPDRRHTVPIPDDPVIGFLVFRYNYATRVLQELPNRLSAAEMQLTLRLLRNLRHMLPAEFFAQVDDW